MDALGVQYLAQEYFDIHTGRARDLKLPKAIYIFPVFFSLFLHITLHNFFLCECICLFAAHTEAASLRPAQNSG